MDNLSITITVKSGGRLLYNLTRPITAKGPFTITDTFPTWSIGYLDNGRRVTLDGYTFTLKATVPPPPKKGARR